MRFYRFEATEIIDQLFTEQIINESDRLVSFLNHFTFQE